MPTTIRPAETKDVQALTELMVQYIVDFYERPMPPLEKLHQLIDTLLNRKEGIQFVAECDGALIGFATLYFTYSTLQVQKAAILNDLFVVEKFRGTGIASELFTTCHTFTKDHGYAYMSWETAQDNKRAQRFYEKMGGSRGAWVSYSI